MPALCIVALSGAFGSAVLAPEAGGTLLSLIALIAVAALLTEDIACLGAGLLVGQGQIGFLTATLACMVGMLVGNVLLYWAGSGLGRPCLSRAPLKWILTDEQVGRSSEWFQRRGPLVVFICRFLPGTRVAAYFTAGLLHTGFRRFLFYFTLSLGIWTPLLVGIGGFFGARIFDYFEVFERWALPSVIVLAVLIGLLVKLLVRLFPRRG